MVDKNFCMSSYLSFRYIIDDDKDFCLGLKHRVHSLIPEYERILVDDECDVDRELKKQFERLRGKTVGILLSGGMDSACLAAFVEPGTYSYTFRFMGDENGNKDLDRAKKYCERYNLIHHEVNIDWNIVEKNVDKLMLAKGAPVHSIEPQIYQAALQAKNDGIEVLVIGDAADYVFGGMDGLYAKDWTYDEFKNRYIYIKPEDVLNEPIDMDYAFAKYKKGEKVDFINLMHEYTDIESYSSYDNSLKTADIDYLDPYEILKMSNPIDLIRVRNGESKYIIRELFKMKYPDIPVPEKIPMPRPVDIYFANWEGPVRPEFKKNLDMSKFTGNQKWQMWCLERFLNMIEKQFELSNKRQK